MKIVILTGDITYNRGDRGILAAEIDLIRRIYPEADLVYDSYRPAQDAPWYPARVIPRGVKAFFAQLRELATCNLVVWGGGGLLADNASRVKIPYWCVRILLIRLILRKKVMAWGLGIIAKTGLGAFFLRMVMNRIDVVTVRDKNSFDDLKKAGVSNRSCFLTGDAAALLEPGPKERGEQILLSQGVAPQRGKMPAAEARLAAGTRLAALCLSFCSFHYNPRALIPYMVAKPLGLAGKKESPDALRLVSLQARLCDWLAEKYDATVLLLPTYVAPWEDDNRYARMIRDQSRHPEKVVPYLFDAFGPKDYASMFRHFDLVVSVPMHHNYFALVAGAPCINLYYEPKGRDLFLRLKAEKWMMDLADFMKPGGFDLLIRKVEALLSQRERVWPPVLREFETVKNEAMKSVDLFKNLAERLSGAGTKD